MTGLGTEIVRHDEVRLIEDTDGDGYADKGTVFADGFNSIQGLAYHASRLGVPVTKGLVDATGVDRVAAALAGAEVLLYSAPSGRPDTGPTRIV
jgi:glucose/arabinose dehydrogenase